MDINRDAYKEGFRAAILHVKEAMENAAPSADTEQSSQQGTPSTRIESKATETVKPFGNKNTDGKENLKDVFMKRDDLSHGPSSSVSGEGTDNYK